MTESSTVSRRSILKAGAGIAASAVSATAMAKIALASEQFWYA